MTYFTNEHGFFVDGQCVRRDFFDDVAIAQFWIDQICDELGAEARALFTWKHLPGGNVQVMGASFAPDTFIEERDIPHEFRPWRPFEEVAAYGPDGEMTMPADTVFLSNSHYLVFKREVEAADPTSPSMVHLSMRTVENDARHDWREMQRVKNEVCGEEWEAIELYPAEDRVVDSANQFHLFCFPFRLPFGFPSGVRHNTQEAAEVGATQRERESA